jgi:hypothetical protein
MIKTGPKGGTYYITASGRKQYLKYKDVPADLFCGPDGGYPPGTYPVNTKTRCIAALSYARHAPNPCGIAECVRRKCGDSVGRSSKLFQECGIPIPPTSDKTTKFYNYTVKDNVKTYLTNRVLKASAKKIRGKQNLVPYFPMNRYPTDSGLKEYIVKEVLSLAENHSRDEYGSTIITLKMIKHVIDSDNDLKMLI